MKKIVALLLALMMVLPLAACGKAPEPNEPEVPEEPDGGGETVEEKPDPLPAVSGFAYFTEAEKMQFQYPAAWVLVTADTLKDEEISDFVTNTLYIGVDNMKTYLESNPAYLYNPDAIAEGFPAYLVWATSAAGTHTDDSLASASSVAHYKQSVEAHYPEKYEDFRWIEEPAVVEFGARKYVRYMFAYLYEGVDIVTYQVITVLGDTIYSFSYHSDVSKMDEGMEKTLEKVLATLELK